MAQGLTHRVDTGKVWNGPYRSYGLVLVVVIVIVVIVIIVVVIVVVGCWHTLTSTLVLIGGGTFYKNEGTRSSQIPVGDQWSTHIYLNVSLVT